MTDWKPFKGLEDKYEISTDFRLRKTKDETMATVKPLEWQNAPVPPSGEYLAPSVVGLYCIPHATPFRLRFRDTYNLGEFGSIEDAQAAAQDDYERRILSAIA